MLFITKIIFMLKQFISCLLLGTLLTPQITKAQLSTSITKKPALFGFSGNATDFTTSSISTKGLEFGPSLMFWKGLSKNIDYSIRYNALFSGYSKVAQNKSNDLINEFEGSFHARALSDNHLLNPFLTAGIGIGEYGGTWAPYAPLGGGLQLNLLSEAYLFLQTNYRVSLSESKLDKNLFYSLGVAGNIGNNKTNPEPVKVVPIPEVVKKDTDNDGVNDDEDKCPSLAGLVSLSGCPDQDKDGVADNDDKCPAVSGLARLQGCPIPDTDNDGVNDEEDKCPAVSGLARLQGCPIPDTDNDGVNDEEDKCPALSGTAANNGCPEIKEEVRKRLEVAAKNIYYATGSSKLLAKSSKSLNEVAQILKQDANLKLDINGYTDNSGKPEANQKLSELRAAAVLAYLKAKGIEESRLSFTGFGQENPVADNKTAAGKAKNRRVELKLHYN
jgi:OmpA-OmpF porin, OOP family